tara:strand:- start:160 stop:471 length:312 start_codon:yes stop_codon:yes gene_type:complete
MKHDFIWTQERVKYLVEGRSGAALLPFGSIARTLGTTKRRCVQKYARLESGVDAMPVVIERFEKKCLQCRNGFQAERFIFVCTPCKETAVFRSNTTDFALAGS